jgi:hypothetical protein
MRPNAFFPSLDIGTDPAKIRDWAQAAEDLGYAYIEVPDHVFGAKGREGWVPLYNEKDLLRIVPLEAAEVVERCLKSDDEKIALMAPQIAFDRGFGKPGCRPMSR